MKKSVFRKKSENNLVVTNKSTTFANENRLFIQKNISFFSG